MSAETTHDSIFKKASMTRILKIAIAIQGALLSMVGPVLAQAPIQVNPGILKAVSNGTVEIAYAPCSEKGEFPPAWTKELVFVRAPEVLCVRWSGKRPTAWGKWELFKVTDGPDQLVASGALSSVLLASASASFQINLRPSVQEFNTSSGLQRYRVMIRSKDNPSDSRTYRAWPAFLAHQPRPPAVNPYACMVPPPNSSRRVTLEIPKMTVNKTSSTSGDGDRDELYFEVGRIGPLQQSIQKRLPSADDYYEAKNGKTVNANGWTNQDETKVPNPVFWSGVLDHDESALLSITAMEQDNSDLQSIKEGIIAAMQAVAATASAVGGPYGLVVAAVAETVAGGSALFIPNTDRHDVVGFVVVRVSNSCGFVKTEWVTFESKDTVAGKVKNQFLNMSTLENIESRLVTLDANPQFWPDGVDWSPYAYAYKADEFWWIANGTSNSKYTFMLKAKSEMP